MIFIRIFRLLHLLPFHCFFSIAFLPIFFSNFQYSLIILINHHLLLQNSNLLFTLFFSIRSQLCFILIVIIHQKGLMFSLYVVIVMFLYHLHFSMKMKISSKSKLQILSFLLHLLSSFLPIFLFQMLLRYSFTPLIIALLLFRNYQLIIFYVLNFVNSIIHNFQIH